MIYKDMICVDCEHVEPDVLDNGDEIHCPKCGGEMVWKPTPPPVHKSWSDW